MKKAKLIAMGSVLAVSMAVSGVATAATSTNHTAPANVKMGTMHKMGAAKKATTKATDGKCGSAAEKKAHHGKCGSNAKSHHGKCGAGKCGGKK